MLKNPEIRFVFNWLIVCAIITSIFVIGVACFDDTTQAKTTDPEQDNIIRLQSRITKYATCAWVEKYDSCFCGSSSLAYDFTTLTWAPDKVCGK
jgi:hypothetical protein